MKTKTSPVFGLSLALLFGAALSVAAADSTPCKRWDVSGKWELRLDDGGKVQVNLQQAEWQGQSANLAGTAEYKIKKRHSHSTSQKGVVSGNITGNSFAILLEAGAEKHRFTGLISTSGKLEGTCTTCSNNVHWVSSSSMTCADATPPASKEKPGDPSSTSSTEAGISANPKVVPLSNADQGTTTLTWNAGGAHPDAEVWVQVNDHDAKLVFTGSKGTQTVSVKAGRKYVYILRDGGQQLDTVTVKAAGKSGRRGD